MQSGGGVMKNGEKGVTNTIKVKQFVQFQLPKWHEIIPSVITTTAKVSGDSA